MCERCFVGNAGGDMGLEVCLVFGSVEEMSCKSRTAHSDDTDPEECVGVGRRRPYAWGKSPGWRGCIGGAAQEVRKTHGDIESSVHVREAT